MSKSTTSTPHGIVIFGASGSGCTTLGRELSQLLNFEHFDTDDYFFIPTDPPFTQERPLRERVDLLCSEIKSDFILTGCIREWENALDSMLSMGVFVITPTAIRVERLEKREFNRNGERIKSGGDLYARHRKFIEYVSTYDTGGMETRSLAAQQAWANTQTCPVLRVDGARPVSENAAWIAEQYLSMHKSSTS